MSDILGAVQDGSIEDVKRIIETKTGSVTETNERGETPLHIAVHNKDLELVKYLVENKSNVNAQDNIGATPLNIICDIAYQDAEIADNNTVCYFIAQYLLEKDADPNIATYETKMSPLMIASATVDTDLVQLLIKYKARVNQQDNDSESAISYAVSSDKALHPASKLHTIEVLIKAGGKIMSNEDYKSIKCNLKNDDIHFAIKFDELIEKYHLDIMGNDVNEI